MRPLVSFCRTKPIEVLLLLEQQLDIERLDPQKLWFDWLMGWMWFPCSFLTLTAVLQYVDLIYGNLYPPNFQDCCCYEETSSKYQRAKEFSFCYYLNEVKKGLSFSSLEKGEFMNCLEKLSTLMAQVASLPFFLRSLHTVLKNTFLS